MALPNTICGMFDIPNQAFLDRFSRDGLWILQPVEVGTDPGDHSGWDFTSLANAGVGVIVRAQARFGADGGSLPPMDQAGAFAQRVANFCAASPGLAVLHIGNEFQHRVEWWNHAPRPPEMAGYICGQVYLAVVEVRPELLVGMGAVAPWNTDYQGMDWLEYQTKMYEAFMAVVGHGPDINVVHTYTHGVDPELVDDDVKMDAPFEDRFYNFRSFEQTLEALPEWAQGMNSMIAEMDQNVPWLNDNSGWIKRAYARIDAWNQEHKAKVLCALPFRWQGWDDYGIDGREGVIEDFADAYQVGYTWREETTMAWRTTYETSFEEGSADYQGESELTCPIGWIPAWKEGGGEKRPEYDMKSAALGHPEIHTGMWAANFFTMSSKIHACLLKKFSFSPGQYYRVTAWAMGVTTDEGVGMRVVTDPDGGDEWVREDTPHSEWWANWGDVAGWNRKWVQLTCQGQVGATGMLSLFLVGSGEYELEGTHFHWDDVRVEVEDGTIPPPPPPPPPVTGDHSVQILIDGVDIGSLPFDVEAEVAVSGVRFTKK